MQPHTKPKSAVADCSLPMAAQTSALDSIGFWQGRFGFSQEGRSQKTAMRASRRVRVAQSACAQRSGLPRPICEARRAMGNHVRACSSFTRPVCGARRPVGNYVSACSIGDWQGRFGFSQEVRSPGDGHAFEFVGNKFEGRPKETPGCLVCSLTTRALLGTEARARRCAKVFNPLKTQSPCPQSPRRANRG